MNRRPPAEAASLAAAIRHQAARLYTATLGPHLIPPPCRTDTFRRHVNRIEPARKPLARKGKCYNSGANKQEPITVQGCRQPHGAHVPGG